MVSVTRVVGSILLLIAGIAIGRAIDHVSFDSINSILLPGIATLAAAFFGARYAFDLQNAKEKQKKEDEQIAAANRAIFALSCKYNKLKNFYDQFIAPVENDNSAFLKMPPLVELMKDDIQLDIDSISFLLETDHRNLLGQVTITIATYQSAMDAVNARSRFHLHEVQPILETKGIVEGAQYSKSEILDTLGPRVFAIITQATTQTIQTTKTAISSVDSCAKELTTAFRSIFPERQIIEFAPLEKK